MDDTDTKRYFRAEWNDDGVVFTVVARDLEHAKSILRESGAEFGDPATAYDQADSGFEWWEMSTEKVERTKCDRDDGHPSTPLSKCNLGEWFCSEW